MRKKSYKGRCEKRSLPKCPSICKTYDAIQSVYTDMLQSDEMQASWPAPGIWKKRRYLSGSAMWWFPA